MIGKDVDDFEKFSLKFLKFSYPRVKAKNVPWIALRLPKKKVIVVLDQDLNPIFSARVEVRKKDFWKVKYLRKFVVQKFHTMLSKSIWQDEKTARTHPDSLSKRCRSEKVIGLFELANKKRKTKRSTSKLWFLLCRKDRG